MIGAVVIGHGDLPLALVDAVFTIVGKQEKVVAISNRALSMDELKKRIQSAIKEMDDVVVFTDLPGGSCTIACKALQIPVITGVNLPMLLEFMLSREKTTVEEMVKKLTEVGREGIRRL
ncbi:PTS mannose transporter subunit IIAB [candidate division WOR-3 bacterium]|uniref:PTS mannose transporter subunit IIAB n=1 Tax=candidate division WOR-3 bacterium TaxID=2052148 RepID=A0A660SFW3_UNCW3|nr:MAG: PTS mannose transporter subunit IIAB [candidate division WOR-3 bacterium]